MTYRHPDRISHAMSGGTLAKHGSVITVTFDDADDADVVFDAIEQLAQPRVPADLEGIRERAEKATPGRLTIRGAWNGIVANESGSQVASFVMTPDAKLFAHARADILSLLARIAELESRGGA